MGSICAWSVLRMRAEVTHADLPTLPPAGTRCRSRSPGWAAPLRRSASPRRTALRGGTRLRPTPQSVLRAGSSRLIACSVLRATSPQKEVPADNRGTRKAQDKQRVGPRPRQPAPGLRRVCRRSARRTGATGRLRHGAVSRPINLIGLHTRLRRRRCAPARCRARTRRRPPRLRRYRGRPRGHHRRRPTRRARRGSRARLLSRLLRRRSTGLRARRLRGFSRRLRRRGLRRLGRWSG